MNRVKLYAVFAGVVHLASFAFMILHVEPFYSWFYSFAWWSFIFFLASVNQLRAGNSRVFNDPLSFLGLALFSVCVWLFFELYNFRLNNWNYLGVPLETYLRWPGYAISFATVLPGLFEVEQLLFNLGLFRGMQGRPIRVSSGLLFRSVVIGFLMMVAPLISPGAFFPLVWLGLIFLLDPFLYRFGRKNESFLGQAEGGAYGLFGRFLVAGFACGLLWEFWNYWAGAKWIYTIPRFDFLRLFEMPLAGYFGFPFFALECYLLYRCFLILWSRWISRSGAARAFAFLLILAFAVLIMRGIDRFTVASYKVMIGI